MIHQPASTMFNISVLLYYNFEKFYAQSVSYQSLNADYYLIISYVASLCVKIALQCGGHPSCRYEPIQHIIVDLRDALREAENFIREFPGQGFIWTGRWNRLDEYFSGLEMCRLL